MLPEELTHYKWSWPRAVSGLPLARRSPVYTQQYFAPFWDDLHHRLTRLVADDVARKPPRPKGKSKTKRG